jgi:hypothetical protein
MRAGGRRQEAGGGRQKAVGTQFVTGIYTPLQKFFALKGEVLDPIVSIKIRNKLEELPKRKKDQIEGRNVILITLP